MKRAADEYENTDSKKSTESKIIRNSHELVDFCRSQLTTTKKAFNGTGVWQRKFHELHVGGNGFVANRRLVRKADSQITTYSSDLATKPTTKVKIKTIRRAASTGYPGVLWASERSCNKQGTCPCSGFVGSGVRDSFLARRLSANKSRLPQALRFLRLRRAAHLQNAVRRLAATVQQVTLLLWKR